MPENLIKYIEKSYELRFVFQINLTTHIKQWGKMVLSVACCEYDTKAFEKSARLFARSAGKHEEEFEFYHRRKKLKEAI